MNKRIRIIGLIIIVVSCSVFFSCKMSSEKLAKEVQKDIVATFQENGTNVKVTKDLVLIKIANTLYTGLITLSADGETEQVSVSVVYDGDTFMWEIE